MPDRIAAPIVPPPARQVRSAPIVTVLAYVGGLAMTPIRAVGALRDRPAGVLSLKSAVLVQLDWLLVAGLPLVGLVHVGMGSFLSMQAYFGATFEAGVGPVVGVGLVRNGAPLLSGFILAGLMACRATTELRTRPRPEIDADPDWIPDRDIRLGLAADERPGPSDARAILPRIVAAMLAGPVLATWGAAVGSAVGFRIANAILGIPMGTLWDSFAEMLWMRDVLGLLAKGLAFGGIAAAVSCFEGTRQDDSPAHVAALRACCLAMLLILAVNLSWFLFAYLAGPPFGPTVLPT
ncbi:ABC transporter permease [Tautonia sociabilis]|uniref:ABC transporter permease n=1 Tax=Tautonia sociabilis TaxID=2080755 RepID=A0A432MHI0_9BACT|nr:ABC transporter permease [Tautonia sociabilis]RUL86758.1 ABC transporter permease [Tautonia sociabilis]